MLWFLSSYRSLMRRCQWFSMGLFFVFIFSSTFFCVYERANLHVCPFPLQGEDLRMQDIMKLAHQFLQNFCAGNQQNQALLHKHINLFLNPGVSITSISQLLLGRVEDLNIPKYHILGKCMFSSVSFPDPGGCHHAAHLHE